MIDVFWTWPQSLMIRRRMLLTPMLSNVPAGTKPHAIPLARMIEEFDQSDRLSRSTDKAIVQRKTHDLWALGALFVHEIEAIHHVLGEFLGRTEPRVAIESIVVGFERIRNDQVILSAKLHPKRQFVAKIVAVVQETAVLDEKSARVHA